MIVMTDNIGKLRAFKLAKISRLWSQIFLKGYPQSPRLILTIVGFIKPNLSGTPGNPGICHYGAKIGQLQA